MIDLRRFLHAPPHRSSSPITKAALETFKHAPTIVHPNRNEELIKYQAELKRQRQLFRQELATKYPTKATIKAEERTIRAKARDEQWGEYLGKVKKAYADPESPIYSNRHPCRPIVDHAKSVEERQENCRRLAASRKQVQVMRRKYLSHLTQTIANDFITKDNLIAKIQYALNNPVSYNVVAEEIVHREKNVRLALRQYRVQADTPAIPPAEAFTNANCLRIKN